MSIYIWIAIAVLVFVVFLAMFANGAVREFLSAYDEANEIVCGSCLKAVDFAQNVNQFEFSNSLKIIQGKKSGVSDCYHTGARVVEISNANYGNASIAALAVIAHELGHAQQERDELKMFSSCLKKRKIAKWLALFIFPLLIAGVVCMFFLPVWIGGALVVLGILSFVFAISVKVSLLRVEKDASKRALVLLENYASFDNEELETAKNLLKKASNTYLSDILNALLSWTGLTRRSKLSGY